MENRTSTFFSIYLVYFLDYFGYALAFGVFGPLMLNPEFGIFSLEISLYYRNIALGLLFAIYPLFQLISAPLFGDIADHFGRKKTFYILNIGAMIGYFFSGLAIYMSHFPLLLFSRIITGVFSSHRGICMASLSDLSSNEQTLSKNYGVIGTLGGLSWIISMLVGGYLSYTIHPAIPFWITTALSFLSLCVIIFFFYETHERKTEERKTIFTFDYIKRLRNINSCFQVKGIKTLFLFYLVMMIGWGINLLWLNPYTLSRYKISVQTLFILLASTGLVWSIGSSFINKLLLKRFQSPEITFIGSCGLFLIFIICSLSKNFNLFSISILLASAFGAITWTNALSIISLNAPKDIQGKIMGISQSFGSFSLLLAPLIAGIIGGINTLYIYPLAAFFIFISVLILAIAFKEKIIIINKREN